MTKECEVLVADVKLNLERAEIQSGSRYVWNLGVKAYSGMTEMKAKWQNSTKQQLNYKREEKDSTD